MRQENLYDRYWELLGWLEYEDKPSEAIWHPLFYTYPFGLRFELGEYALDDEDAYIRSAYTRGQRIWDTVFSPDDEVLLIFDGTPDKELKAELKHLRMQRVRAKWLPHSPEDEWDGDYFYRYLYAGPASEFSFSALLARAFFSTTAPESSSSIPTMTGARTCSARMRKPCVPSMKASTISF